MANMPGKLVVRTYAPAWRWVLLSAAVLVVGLALLAAYELGLYKAGYDAMQAEVARAGLRRQIDQLQQTEHQLRLQLAAAEETRVADVRERSEVARTIGELQAQVERQQQDVEFYRGLVAQPPDRDTNVAVRVQQFHITADAQAQRFVLHFTLNRVNQPEQAISGTLVITLDGSQNGLPVTQNLAALTGGKDHIEFGFRYYAHLDQPISLPAAFKPDSVTIELRPARKGAASYRQTFIWDVDPS
jgi:hypothetical protein